MTREEAIKVLLNEWKCIDRNDGVNCDRKCESCDLVMDSFVLKDAYNAAIKALEQEPCKDAISREAVLQMVSKGCQELRGVYGRCEELINALPSVNPQAETTTVTVGRMKGETIMWYECYACGEPVDRKDCYCSMCGRKLIHEQ